jgi:predicted nuclease with TOPRIM domain
METKDMLRELKATREGLRPKTVWNNLLDDVIRKIENLKRENKQLDDRVGELKTDLVEIREYLDYRIKYQTDLLSQMAEIIKENAQLKQYAELGMAITEALKTAYIMELDSRYIEIASTPSQLLELYRKQKEDDAYEKA